jgi:hypothetical protein
VKGQDRAFPRGIRSGIGIMRMGSGLTSYLVRLDLSQIVCKREFWELGRDVLRARGQVASGIVASHVGKSGGSAWDRG